MSTIEALQAAIAGYWRRDDEHGSETLRPAVIGQLDYMRDLLDQPQTDRVRQALYATAAELSRLAGLSSALAVCGGLRVAVVGGRGPGMGQGPYVL
jgi:hypothetical protein